MAHVIVAGGGYAGISAVRALARGLDSSHRITLLDRDSFHEMSVLLPPILSGRIPLESAQLPYSRILPRLVHFVQCEVRSLDVESGEIQTDRGGFRADWLLLALGRIPNHSVFPGSECAVPFRTASGAVALRARLAAATSGGGTAHVVLLGAGYTSTEVAGEVLTWGRRQGANVRATIVAAEERLLPLGNARIASAATRLLSQGGVSLRLGTPIRAVDDRSVYLMDGQEVGYDVLIWGGPAMAPGEVGRAPREQGRVAVDPYLRIQGQERAFATGDIAASYDYVHDRVVAASAQFAVQEGTLAAENLVAAMRGAALQEYRPVDAGEALDMGDLGAVAEVGGILVQGAAARAAKRAALIRYLTRIAGPVAALTLR